MPSTAIFWFRRDLRIEDNTALHHALEQYDRVIPIFIFDEHILKHLPETDARVTFIHEQLLAINEHLTSHDSGVQMYYGQPENVWPQVIEEHQPKAVFTNRDYEPYALERDEKIAAFLEEKEVQFKTFKDSVIFEKSEVVKNDGLPYTVYTPFKNKWLEHFKLDRHQPLQNTNFKHLAEIKPKVIQLAEMGFKIAEVKVKPFRIDDLDNYDETRDYPAKDATSYLSPHLRFGTVSVRQLIEKLWTVNKVFISELIWREFFMQVLYHFPHVVDNSFKPKYDHIEWRNNEAEFKKWCAGETGYPLVDAGMRELNQTGYMHNRVRMVVASFLVKHLLIDWRWGEAYFAEKLLDFDLSANNGNWQWAAGTGCDAAPYFRIFNPIEQFKKFDKQQKYVKKWIPDFPKGYDIEPMVEHKMARQRALDTYKAGLEKAKA